ncbi:MAG: radical SAM/SPASM domain-containing protein [Phycisphaerae bacterium]
MSATALEIAPPESVYSFLRTHPEYGGASKARNYYQLAEARGRGDLLVHAAPVQIRFEPDARCNLRCCWAQRNPKHPGLRPRGGADPDLVRRLIDQIGESLYAVNLHHWGEPTLNPRLPELVRLFHDAGVCTTFHTNLTLMTAELAAALIEAGLDLVSGSIDGVSQPVYGQYRINGNVDRALAGLRHLARQRRGLGRMNPHIRWQFLVFPHNEHEVEPARRLASEIGADVFDAVAGSGLRWTPEEGFKPRQAARRPQGLLCEDPWYGFAVDWDGAVQLCCRAFQARHVMGHMAEDDLRNIFDNERFQVARRVLRDGTWNEGDKPIPCTGCNKVKYFVPGIARLNHRLTLG